MTLRFPVVVRSPNWLGDAIMSFPAVNQLKIFFGTEPLTVACPEKLVDVWRLCPFVDRVIALTEPRRMRESAKQLREHRFKTAILLTNSLRTAMEARMAWIPNVIGFAGHSRRWLLSQVAPVPETSAERLHQQYEYLSLVKFLGASDEPLVPSLKISKSSSNQISLCPGAEFGEAKRWLQERFVEVGKSLQEKTGLPVVLLGASGDRDLAEQIATAIPGSINRVGKTSLGEFAQELAKSKLVVCNDSGAMHLAAVLQIPTVAIFGSTEPRRTGPLGNSVTVLRHQVMCSPCYLRTCPLDFRCMNEVTVAEVLAAAERRLA